MCYHIFQLSRRHGGIGRHKGLKIPRSKIRTGSIPVAGTRKTPFVYRTKGVFLYKAQLVLCGETSAEFIKNRGVCMNFLKKTMVLLLVTMLLLSGCAGTASEGSADLSPVPAETAAPETTLSVEATTESEPTEVPAQELDHEAIYAAIEEIAQDYIPVGLQVAVIDDGQVVGSYAYGWATNNQDPMTTDHKIRVASLSKVVVGVAAMLMHEEGIMDINGDIGDAWGIEVRNPQFPEIPITPYLILSHTSSIASYEVEPETDYQSVYFRMPYAFWGCEPGDMDDWCYNNYAFRVLGMTLELAADQTLDDYLDNGLFSIMDIEASFVPRNLTQPELIATLYNGGAVARSVEKQLRQPGYTEPGQSGAYFAGSLTISAEDLAKIIAMLAADGMYEGQQVLSAESVALMETKMDSPTILKTWQAHPMFHVPQLYGREEIFFHTGYGYGVYSCASYDNATGDGVVVVSTGARGYKDPYDISMISTEINEYLYSIL